MAKISKTKKTKNKPKREWDEGLSALNRNAAGIDVGSAEHYVAVPGGRDPESVQTFGSFTSDLHRMAQWLKVCGIETVVMQATGVYWIALFQILESYGFQVNVVNARHTKTLPGRKTDVLECQWLQKLHTFGLLNNSFRPTDRRIVNANGLTPALVSFEPCYTLPRSEMPRRFGERAAVLSIHSFQFWFPFDWLHLPQAFIIRFISEAKYTSPGFTLQPPAFRLIFVKRTITC
jgi:hypothetical protein